MALPLVLMRLVPRFSRGAPAYAYLGSPYETVYPMVAGYGQQRQFRATAPANADYSRLRTAPVTPQSGRFATNPRSTRTSPLIPNIFGTGE